LLHLKEKLVDGSARNFKHEDSSGIWSVMSCSLLKAKACCLLYVGFFLGSPLNLEDGGETFLRNVG
jgi:hypothetical protein